MSIIKTDRKQFQFMLKELSKATGIAELNLSLIENDPLEVGIRRATLIEAALGDDP